MSLIERAKRIKTIAEIGLLYSVTGYDRERYEELLKISLEILGEQFQRSPDEIKSLYAPCLDYPTVKVDVRGFVLNTNKEILLVKEQSDQKWSIPGGWAEPGFSPKEAIVKEVREETGIDVIPANLLALYDIRCHPHPPTPYSIYKIIIHCKPLHFNLNKGFDILDVGFFSLSNLPPLSENRILKSQMDELFTLLEKNNGNILLD